MRILLNRRLHINMGDFEHMETTSSVEIDTDKDADLLKDLGIDPTDIESIEEFIHEEVQKMLAPDVEDAHYLTKKDDDETFSHAYYQEHHRKEGKN